MALPWTTTFPGNQTVYVPTVGGKVTQANLIVSYARDPKRFAVNRLAMRTPTQTQNGMFLKLRPEALARLVASPNSATWNEGQERPKGTDNQQDFSFVPYFCRRLAKSNYVGYLTKEQASWDVQDTQLQTLAHLMMTYRAAQFYGVAMNSANHIASHVVTATVSSSFNGVTGGFWSAGTVTNQIVNRSLKYMANEIRKSTLDAVSYMNLTLVIPPEVAITLSTSPEISDYFARSQFALAQVRGDGENQNEEWGLPQKLYGYKLVIDGTLRTTTAPLDNPGTMQDVIDPTFNKALVLASPGDLKENVGQLNSQFASMHMFVYNGQEMVTETHDDSWNKRIELSVSENYAFVMAAPETSGIFTNLFS